MLKTLISKCWKNRQTNNIYNMISEIKICLQKFKIEKNICHNYDHDETIKKFNF